MDVTELTDTEQGNAPDNNMPEMERMAWDMQTVVFHGELNNTKTCPMDRQQCPSRCATTPRPAPRVQRSDSATSCTRTE
eukprot:8736143-Heterocapsa_arctica.AAC.1